MTAYIYERNYAEFGRHAGMFGDLSKFLNNDKPYSGLVVGAGLNRDVLLTWSGIPVMGFRPEDLFSWEPVELLGILRRFNHLSGVSVIDDCSEVCVRIQEQNAVLAHDMAFKDVRYLYDLLGVLPHQTASPEQVEEVNIKFKEKGIGNRVSLIAGVDSRSLDQIICGDFLAESAELQQYDVITMLESVRYMSSTHTISGRVRELLRHGGFLVFGDGGNSIDPQRFKWEGLTPVVPPRIIWNPKRYWCEAIFQKQ